MITLYSSQLLLDTCPPTTHDPHLYLRVKQAYSSCVDSGHGTPDFSSVVSELVSLFAIDSFYETRKEVARDTNLPVEDPVVRAIAMEACQLASKNFCEGIEPTIEDILTYERLCFSKFGETINSPQISLFGEFEVMNNEDNC